MMPTPDHDVEETRPVPRAMAITGILFALLFTASVLLIRRAVPGPGDAISTDAGFARSLVIGLNLLPFAGIIFLWFVGVVRDYVGVREDRFFATIVLGSGLLFIGMLFVATGIAGGLLSGTAAGLSRAADAGIFLFGRMASSTIATAYAGRMAGVFTFSTTILTSRVSLIPRWLSYFGFLLAIILLIGISRIEWIILLFPIWVFVFSMYILIKHR